MVAWGRDHAGQVGSSPPGAGLVSLGSGGDHGMVLDGLFPNLLVSGVVAGQAASLNLTGFTPNGRVFVAWSSTGGGPSSTMYGPTLLSPPFRVLPVLTADAIGDLSLSQPIPAGTTGLQIWTQALDETFPVFSNGVSFVIG